MTHEAAILSYLQRGKTITPIQALNVFGCFRLAPRIHDLRSKGYRIKTEIFELSSGKKIARYYLQ